MKKIVFILTSFAILFSACEKLNPENAPLKVDTNIPANTITIDGHTVNIKTSWDATAFYEFGKNVERTDETFSVEVIDGNISKEVMSETKEYKVIKESGYIVDFIFHFNVYDIGVVKDIKDLEFDLGMMDVFTKYKYGFVPFVGERIYDEFDWERGTTLIVNKPNKLRTLYIADMSAFRDMYEDDFEDIYDFPFDNDKFVKGTYLVKELNSYAMNITGSFETENGLVVSFNVDFMTK